MKTSHLATVGAFAIGAALGLPLGAAICWFTWTERTAHQADPQIRLFKVAGEKFENLLKVVGGGLAGGLLGGVACAYSVERRQKRAQLMESNKTS